MDFRNSNLSRRLNAILHNCGRSITQAKLADFEDRFGIKSTVVNPAYSSQTCNACGYVDNRNRRSQSKFQCLWCGHTKHADLNAALNIGERRALPVGSVFQRKEAVRAELVRQFGERRIRSMRSGKTGSRGAPADPRTKNPHFGGLPEAVVRLSERREASMKSGQTQALTGCVIQPDSAHWHDVDVWK